MYNEDKYDTMRYNIQWDTIYNTNNMIQYTMEYNVQWRQI